MHGRFQPQRSRISRLTPLSLGALVACGGAELDGALSNETPPKEAPQTAPEAPGTMSEALRADVRASAMSAASAADIAGDLGEFFRSGFVLGGGGLGGLNLPGASLGALGSGLPIQFGAPAGCSYEFAVSGQGLSLAHDCTLPSGRHISGSLEILNAFNGCGAANLSLRFDLLVESRAGAGDMLSVEGSVDLDFGAQALTLALRFEKLLQVPGHSIRHSIAACSIIDHGASVLALNGQIVSDIDGTYVRALEIIDLQKAHCEVLPYTGTVRFESPQHEVVVDFDRDTPDTSRVRVTVDGQLVDVDVDARVPTGRVCATPPPASPIAYDYASCGGCGQPTPTAPPPPPTGDSLPPGVPPEL